MAENIKVLRQRSAQIRKRTEARLDKAEAEGRDLSASEKFDQASDLQAMEDIGASINREVDRMEIERHTEPVEHAGAAVGALGRSNGGFKNLGEMLLAVRKFEMSKGTVRDPRLFAGPAGLDEAMPAEGGFLVQKDFSAELLQRMYSTGEIINRCRKVPISGSANGIKINAIDEDSRADGSRWGGVLGYWANEAASLTQSKPKFRKVELQLNKLIALCYATDELLEDGAALESVIQESFAEEMIFKVEDAIFNGTGAGQPAGILNSGALITQAKASGDSGAVLTTPDVLAMWSRLWVKSRKNAAWFCDVSVEPQLYQLVLGSPSLGQILLYTPPGDKGSDRPGMLMGRPVIFHEHGAVLGTPGDIVLADMSQYVLIDKNGVRQDYSMHVNFLTDEGVFRFTYRVDGQGWWKKPLTPKSNGPTVSPFIALATRS